MVNLFLPSNRCCSRFLFLQPVIAGRFLLKCPSKTSRIWSASGPRGSLASGLLQIWNSDECSLVDELFLGQDESSGIAAIEGTAGVICAGMNDGFIRVVDANTCRPVCELRSHQTSITSLCSSTHPNAVLVSASGNSGTLVRIPYPPSLLLFL